MRVFLAGASGVIGRRLVPLLIRGGHDVAGMTRSTDNADALSELGAEPVVCDVFDVDKLCRVVTDFAPELVMHQLTDLPDDPAHILEFGPANARIRRDGTRNLIAAASAAGARRLLAQSIAWKLPGDGGAAVEDLERMVLDARGVVLRYGRFYGPGTYSEDEAPSDPRIHIDSAAEQTVQVLTSGSGVMTIVDL